MGTTELCRDQSGMYRELDSARNAIRIIRLEPGGNIEDSPLRLLLVYTRLDNDQLPYEALSYCWGSLEHHGQQVVTIERVDGEPAPYQTFRLGNELFRALASLRLPSTLRLLRANQICINQLDLKERADQVLLMGKIYACASRVVVWLGDLDHETSQDIHVIRQIAERFQHDRKSLCPATDLQDEYCRKCRAPHGEIAEGSITRMDNDRIFKRHWFTRV